ncbi:tannase-domain-containing protein [Colletotrichum caudatum]|nr:tannase-domain-containing protein [Colletotrichum caudatum]
MGTRTSYVGLVKGSGSHSEGFRSTGEIHNSGGHQIAISPFREGEEDICAFITGHHAIRTRPGSRRPRRPGTFFFPAIPGTRHVGTTAVTVRNYTGFRGLMHDAAALVPALSGVRPFYNVTVSYTHPGHDDVVSVHVWLPLEEVGGEAAWNGRFLGLGGGGFVVGDVDGDAPSAAVHEGYAAAVTDGGHGHDMFLPADDWALKSPGNLDWPLLVNYGHRSLHELAVVGKSLTKEFYGGEEGPRWAYWKGCSTGRQQGLALAQRYPGDFDECWALMRWKGYWLSACELGAIVAAGVEACDMTDGVADGRTGATLTSSRSRGGRTSATSTPKGGRKVSNRAVEVVASVMKGVVDEEGAQMSPRVVGAPLAGLLGLMNNVCKDESDRTTGCKGMPFGVADGWIRLFIEKDAEFDVDNLTEEAYREVFRTGVEEFESIIGNGGAEGPDLRRFRERGGKVLMWHGLADQAVPVKVARGVFERARRRDEARGVDTAEYWRYFEVPGVNHCISMGGARAAPFPWDAFERLRKWVEDGVSPDELEARKLVPAGENDVGKLAVGDETRKVCRWPEEGVWDVKAWQCLKPGEKLEVTCNITRPLLSLFKDADFCAVHANSITDRQTMTQGARNGIQDCRCASPPLTVLTVAQLQHRLAEAKAQLVLLVQQRQEHRLQIDLEMLHGQADTDLHPPGQQQPQRGIQERQEKEPEQKEGEDDKMALGQ